MNYICEMPLRICSRNARRFPKASSDDNFAVSFSERGASSNAHSSSCKPYHKVTFCNLESKDLAVVIRGL
ncbi:hypothetical protein [Anaplasma phagocytophilum]|uniref:Uncharacterized protein n=2 Tax=Anaplasma phagocytophilum TaxID=948 RepID=Q2GLK9_ANAPZ|nr:hypothetical protein [Anaplasma phagocytophilum]ABD43727.1 hypothetical protein APH_0114 [Anaplasma phagocytophilum str. HZ]